jgi:hypothetical protein
VSFVVKNRFGAMLARFDSGTLWTTDPRKAETYPNLATAIQVQRRFPSDCFIELNSIEGRGLETKKRTCHVSGVRTACGSL